MNHPPRKFQWTEQAHGDAYILKERSYDCLFKTEGSLKQSDLWMDIGAHVGYFSIRISPYVGGVVAVEPEPLNLQHLHENIELNNVQNVFVVNGAAVPGPTEEVELGLGRTFTYTHMVRHVRGRTHIPVQGYNINELLSTYRPNKIKMDCEGIESRLLAEMDFDAIEEMILEWHFTLIPDPQWLLLCDVLDRFTREGFDILRAPANPFAPTKRWTAIIWVKR